MEASVRSEARTRFRTYSQRLRHSAQRTSVITVEVARRIITERVSALPPAEVELSSALGRVLRESVAADDCYPSADRSMMDGYALASDDFSERFRVVGDVTPGIEPGFTIRRGECARIFTGGILPSGADQVLMQEDARREDDWTCRAHSRESPRVL